MSASLLDRVELDALASRGARFDETLSLAELPRLVEALGAEHRGEAAVTCTLEVALARGERITVSGRLKAHLPMTCQRCLETLSHELDVEFSWDFVGAADAAVDAEFERPTEPVRLVDFVEDELLLELPQVPAHPSPNDCGELAKKLTAADDAPAATRTPFAGLKELLRGAK